MPITDRDPKNLATAPQRPADGDPRIPSRPKAVARLAPLALLALCWVATAAATEYSITVFADGDSTNGNCTLREALIAASTNAARDACPAGTASDRIVLDGAGTYVFSSGELASADNGSITVEGPTPGARDAAITLGFQNRFLSYSGSGSVVLRDLEIGFGATSTPGGALSFTGGDLTLDNVGLNFNQADDEGGALYWAETVSEDRRLVIVDSDFVGNGATLPLPIGGAIRVFATGTSEVEIARTAFDGNAATSDAGGPGFGFGGAVAIALIQDAVARITGCRFTENSLIHPAGGFAAGTAVSLEQKHTTAAELRDNAFFDNLGDMPSGSSAALYLDLASASSQLVADRNRFDGNGSTGVAVARQLHVTGTGAALVANALLTGGDVGVEVEAEPTAQVTLAHLTATGNDTGVSITVGASILPSAPVRLVNSIVALNSSEDLALDGTVDQVANLVGVDPLFVASGTGDYTLQAASPAVDTANSTESSSLAFDLAHASRILGPESDVGAFERGGIFADDFESGTVDAWSSVSP